MTGEKLFLLYAYPCVSSRLATGKITKAHADELKGLVESGGQPTRRRLKYCFPNAFRAIRELAETKQREVWSLENVADYWRNNHPGQGDCAVEIITINKIINDGLMGIECCKKHFNIYSLPITVDCKVYVHKSCIIEICE
jgi:hypothetical protein